MLARFGGVPAAIITGEIKDAILLIHYTGVGQAFRGRNLGLPLKQAAHLQAAAAGATLSHTMNEESNAGIRKMNAQLGYRSSRRLPAPTGAMSASAAPGYPFRKFGSLQVKNQKSSGRD